MFTRFICTLLIALVFSSISYAQMTPTVNAVSFKNTHEDFMTIYGEIYDKDSTGPFNVEITGAIDVQYHKLTTLTPQATAFSVSLRCNLGKVNIRAQDPQTGQWGSTYIYEVVNNFPRVFYRTFQTPGTPQADNNWTIETIVQDESPEKLTVIYGTHTDITGASDVFDASGVIERRLVPTYYGNYSFQVTDWFGQTTKGNGYLGPQ